MLYLGPEVVAPVLSALAAIGGVFLMFWRKIVARTRAVMRFFTGKAAPEPPADHDAAS